MECYPKRVIYLMTLSTTVLKNVPITYKSIFWKLELPQDTFIIFTLTYILAFYLWLAFARDMYVDYHYKQ